MRYKIVDGMLIDYDTGEILQPEYDVVPTTISTDEKRFYAATKVPPEDCTDPEQLDAFVKATVDMRGIQIESALDWFKKESDFGVLTLRQKSMMTKPQYKIMKQLIQCIRYKNIILCSRSELCQSLGIRETNLKRTLSTIEQWIKIGEAKKGYIKIFISPHLAYKGRGYGKTSCFGHYYNSLDGVDQWDILLNPQPKQEPPDISDWSKQGLSEIDRIGKPRKDKLTDDGEYIEGGFDVYVDSQKFKDQFYDEEYERSFINEWNDKRLE